MAPIECWTPDFTVFKSQRETVNSRVQIFGAGKVQWMGPNGWFRQVKVETLEFQVECQCWNSRVSSWVPPRVSSPRLLPASPPLSSSSPPLLSSSSLLCLPTFHAFLVSPLHYSSSCASLVFLFCRSSFVFLVASPPNLLHPFPLELLVRLVLLVVVMGTLVLFAIVFFGLPHLNSLGCQ